MTKDAISALLDKPQSTWRKAELEAALLELLGKYGSAMLGWGSAIESAEALTTTNIELLELIRQRHSMAIATGEPAVKARKRKLQKQSEEYLLASLSVYESMKADEEKLAGKVLTQTEALRRAAKRFAQQKGKQWHQVSFAFERKLKSHLNTWAKGKKLSQK